MDLKPPNHGYCYVLGVLITSIYSMTIETRYVHSERSAGCTVAFYHDYSIVVDDISSHMNLSAATP